MRTIWTGVLFLFVISLPVGASNWLRLTRHNDIEIYVDTESIAKRGKLMQAWDRTDYPSPLTMSFTPFKEYRSMKALGYYDCATKTAAVRELILYAGAGGSGEVVGHVSIPVDHLEFKAMAPKTVGAMLLDYICRKNTHVCTQCKLITG